MDNNHEKKVNALYMGLRNIIFDRKRLDADPNDTEKVCAVLIDTNDGKKIFSIAAVADGSCSMYFDNGQYIIGLGKDEDIAAAAKTVAIKSESVLDSLELTDDTDLLPEPYFRTFYIVTNGGVYCTIAPTDDPDGMPPEQKHLTWLLAGLMRTMHESPALRPAQE